MLWVISPSRRGDGWRLFAHSLPLPPHMLSLPSLVTLTSDPASSNPISPECTSLVISHCLCISGLSLALTFTIWGRGEAVSAASLDPEIFHTLWAAPSVCPSVLLLGFSTLLLILLHSPFLMGRSLVPLWPATLQLLFPFFRFLHYLSPPPLRVLTGMTGSRLRLRAGRGRGGGPPRTPAAEHPLPQALHLQGCLAPGDSAPGQAGEDGPGGEARSSATSRKCGSTGWGGWRSGNCRPPQRGKRQWLSVTRADPSPLVASFFSPPPRTAVCVCVCWGTVIPRGDLLLCSPRIWSPSQRGSALATFHVWGRGEEALRDTEKMCQHQGQANQSVPGWEARRGAAHTQPGTHGLPLALTAQAVAWRFSLQSTLSPDLPGICQSHLTPPPPFLCAKDSADPVESAGSWVRGGSGVGGKWRGKASTPRNIQIGVRRDQ